MKINGGATLWARQTIDSDIFFNKPPKWFKIWFYLVSEVNHKDNKQFERGSSFIKYEWIMRKTKTTKNEVAHCVKWLKSATMIATAKATGGFIVKVLNYNAFQSLENYRSDSKSDSKGKTKATQKQHRSDTIHKNGNNDKNEKKKDTLSSRCELIINYLNEKTGSKFNPKNKSTIDLMCARFNEGRTVKDFITVIDKKVRDWLSDDKMNKYLRPSTLFNRTKFENYLNEPSSDPYAKYYKKE